MTLEEHIRTNGGGAVISCHSLEDAQRLMDVLWEKYGILFQGMRCSELFPYVDKNNLAKWHVSNPEKYTNGTAYRIAKDYEGKYRIGWCDEDYYLNNYATDFSIDHVKYVVVQFDELDDFSRPETEVECSPEIMGLLLA